MLGGDSLPVGHTPHYLSWGPEAASPLRLVKAYTFTEPEAPQGPLLFVQLREVVQTLDENVWWFVRESIRLAKLLHRVLHALDVSFDAGFRPLLKSFESLLPNPATPTAEETYRARFLVEESCCSIELLIVMLVRFGVILRPPRDKIAQRLLQDFVGKVCNALPATLLQDRVYKPPAYLPALCPKKGIG